MHHPRILALVLAGGKGGRMGPLTEHRAKPVLPFAGLYRLIDFPLSHCVHSQIDNVWVLEQYQLHSLNDHLSSGRPWDLDRTYGGLNILPPHTGTDKEGFAEGNADALNRNAHFIRQFAPDLLLVASADHVYRLDYRDVIEAHLKSGADVTMVTTRRPLEQASRHGVVKVAKNGKVTDFAYKPKNPKSDIVTTEVFVYDAPHLLALIEKLAAEHGNEGLKDFGHLLIPKLVKSGKAHAFPLEGYWRDVGTLESYWEAHMDLLQDTPPLTLDDPKWPILSCGVQRLPARIHASAKIDNSLIAPGCEVRGEVVRSVLGPGVVVEAGAIVRECVVFENATIGAKARLQRAIVDGGMTVPPDSRHGQPEGDITVLSAEGGADDE